jgi:hypothetical protein
MGFFTKLADNLDEWKAYGAQQKAKSEARNALPVKPMIGPDPRAVKGIGPAPLNQPGTQNPATKNSPQLLAATKVFNNRQMAAKGQPPAPAGVPGSAAPKAPLIAAPPPAAAPLQQPAMAPKPMKPLARGPTAMPKTAFAKGFDKSANVLTGAARKHIAKKNFALPSLHHGSKGGYPIENPAHARNALARVSQFGTPAQKATVRAKVHAKYPNIGKK